MSAITKHTCSDCGSDDVKKKRKYSKQALQNRLVRLQQSLDKEKARTLEVSRNIPWGAGMRRTKCTPSFSREDELRDKIEILQHQIDNYEETLKE